MDEYWTVDCTFLQLQNEDTWSLEMSTFKSVEGRRRICQWIGSGPVTETELDNMKLLWETLICARLNVQLGMDLGLIS